MKVQLFKKNEQEKHLVTDHEEKRSLGISVLKKFNTLKKLRFAVTLIFLLSTLAIILVFITDFVVAVLLILISYCLLIILMIKLFITKKL